MTASGAAMPTVEPTAATSVVEAAIARVLAAERDGREAVDLARRDADALEERARASARALADRTARRIRRIRSAYEARVAAEVAAIDAQAAAHDATEGLSAEDTGRLEAVLARLAAELTGEAR